MGIKNILTLATPPLDSRTRSGCKTPLLAPFLKEKEFFFIGSTLKPYKFSFEGMGGLS